MKRTSEDIPKSMQGKHDLQLESELRDLFKDEGLNPLIGVERRRGIIKVQCADGDYLLTSRLVRQIHPEFNTFSYENGFVTFKDNL